MRRLRKNAFIRALSLFLAVHFLNISVNTSDFNLHSVQQDFSVDDEETVVEIIIENLLGFEEAVSDSTKPDTQQKNAKKSEWKSYSCLKHDELERLQRTTNLKLLLLEANLNQRIQKGLVAIDTPPPRL